MLLLTRLTLFVLAWFIAQVITAEALGAARWTKRSKSSPTESAKAREAKPAENHNHHDEAVQPDDESDASAKVRPVSYPSASVKSDTLMEIKSKPRPMTKQSSKESTSEANRKGKGSSIMLEAIPLRIPLPLGYGLAVG